MKVYADLTAVMRRGKDRSVKKQSFAKYIVVGVIVGVLLCWWVSCVGANERPMFRPNCFPVSGYTCSEIVDAIGKAENSKKYPYGIMKKYKNTTPRQVCLNTVKRRVMDYVKAGEPGRDFIVYLGAAYAPIGAENDPTGLNKNWVKNVKFFLAEHDDKK